MSLFNNKLLKIQKSMLDTDVQAEFNKVGDLSTLQTTNKSSLVNAVNEHTTQLVTKTDKTYVDTQVAAVASGSPKGVYATLSALQTAFPTGNTNIYLVTADGKWYYWNGSAWTAGGTYQATSIGNGSITPNKTSFLQTYQPNIFNLSTVTAGNAVVSTTGNLSVLAGYQASDYIPVTPSQVYNSTKAYDYAWYDSSHVFISGGSPSGTAPTITAPANAAYIRITYANADAPTSMFVNGTLPLTYWSYGQYQIQSTDQEFVNMINRGLSIDPTKTTFFKTQVINFFDTTKTTAGYIVSLSNGTLIANAGYQASDFMPVTAAQVYVSTKAYDYAWYDQNKNFVATGGSPAGTSPTLTVPANAAYIRITYANADASATMFVQGSLPFLYTPYRLDTVFVNSNSRDGFVQDIIKSPYFPTTTSKWSGKKWNVIGDSITEHNSKTTKNYQDYIAQKIGMTVNNYGLSGTGYFNDYTPNGYLAFYKRLNVLDTTADLITVFGGTNDWGQTQKTLVMGSMGDTDGSVSFYGAVDTVFRTLVSMYPTKVIAAFTPLPRDNNWGANSAGYTMEQVTNAIIQVANKYSIPVLDLYHKSNMYPWDTNFKTNNMPDGLHPNDNGHIALADKVLAFLNTL